MTPKIDFDDGATWIGPLGEALQDLLPADVATRIQAANPEYVEDALDALFEIANRNQIIEHTLDFVRKGSVIGYHGTRLNQSELERIEAEGLVPLHSRDRKIRLERALQSHPNWHEAKRGLDDALEKHGSGEFAGRRERQVHLTLSRMGLLTGFNHYLTYGSEFDQHVAQHLLGKDGKTFLSRDGVAYVLSFIIPGETALAAAHPFFSIEDIMRIGDVPNIASEMLKAWSFAHSRPGFEPNRLRVDCGLVFNDTVPADWLKGVEKISDCTLMKGV